MDLQSMGQRFGESTKSARLVSMSFKSLFLGTARSLVNCQTASFLP